MPIRRRRNIGDILLKKSLTLTDAQFKTLSTPIVIVPATQDYANYTIVPTKIPILFGGSISVDQTAGAYTSTATNPFLILTLGSDYSVDFSDPVIASFAGSTAQKWVYNIAPITREAGVTYVNFRDYTNTILLDAGLGLFDNAIALTVGATANVADFGGGNANNIIKVSLYYDYVDV